MSVFTSLVTETVPLPPPADPGKTVTIRKLNPGHLRAAQRAAQLRSIEDMRAMGGPAFIKEIQALIEKPKDAKDGKSAVEEAVAADPLLLYDCLTLLQKSIIGWNLERDHNDLTVLEDLEQDLQEFLGRRILKLARPSLFQTITEAEAARGNA